MKTIKQQLILLLSIILLSSCATNKPELNKIVKKYDFIPFKIPRNSDGVGTLITFDNKSEAVVATLTDCFQPNNLTIDTIQSTVSNYSYQITKNDTINFDTGSIFGNKASLNSVFSKFGVRNIDVNFSDTFVVRVSRISVERQLDSIKSNDQLCIKKLNDKNNFFIERVLGARALSIVLKDSSNRAITFDTKVLNEINIDNSHVKNLAGVSTLVFNEPRLIGYRTWKINMEQGFSGDKLEISPVENSELIKRKLE